MDIPARPWNLQDSDRKLKAMADEIDALSKEHPPATADFVLKLLNLAQAFSVSQSPTLAFEAVRRANFIFPKLVAEDQRAVTVQMVRSVAALGPIPFPPGKDHLFVNALRVLDTLQPPAGTDVARVLSKIRESYLKHGSGNPQAAESVSRTAMHLYDHFLPGSAEAAREHFQLGDIYRRLAKYREAETQLHIAMDLAKNGLLPNSERQQISNALLEVYGRSQQHTKIDKLMSQQKADQNDESSTRGAILRVNSLIQAGYYAQAIERAAATVPGINWEAQLNPGVLERPSSDQIDTWAQDLQQKCAVKEMDLLYEECLKRAKHLNKQNTIGFAYLCVRASRRFLMIDRFSQAEKYAQKALDTRHSVVLSGLLDAAGELLDKNQSAAAVHLYSELLKLAKDSSLKSYCEVCLAIAIITENNTHPSLDQCAHFKALILKNVNSKTLGEYITSSLDKNQNVSLGENHLALLESMLYGIQRSQIRTELSPDIEVARILETQAQDAGDYTRAAELCKLSIDELEKQWGVDSSKVTSEYRRYSDLLRLSKQDESLAASYENRARQISAASIMGPDQQVMALDAIAPVRKVFDIQTTDAKTNIMMDEIDVVIRKADPKDGAFVQKLLDLAIELNRLNLLKAARAMVATANSVFPMLSTQEQRIVAYQLVSTAAKMPTFPTSRGCVHIVPAPGSEPLVTNVLPMINLLSCPSCKEMAGPLSQIRSSYVISGNSLMATPVSESAVKLYDHFFPNSEESAREHFELAKLYMLMRSR